MQAGSAQRQASLEVSTKFIQTCNKVVPTRPQVPRGHPKRCWQDDLNEAKGPNWSHVAKDEHCWTESREGSSDRSETKPDDSLNVSY